MVMQDANIRETQDLIASDKVEGTSVYGADGKLMAEGDQAAEMVYGWLEQG